MEPLLVSPGIVVSQGRRTLVLVAQSANKLWFNEATTGRCIRLDAEQFLNELVGGRFKVVHGATSPIEANTQDRVSARPKHDCACFDPDSEQFLRDHINSHCALRTESSIAMVYRRYQHEIYRANAEREDLRLMPLRLFSLRTYYRRVRDLQIPSIIVSRYGTANGKRHLHMLHRYPSSTSSSDGG